MKRSFMTLLAACLLSGCGVTVTAQAPARSVVASEAVRIPPGHMPPPGSCRIWYPGEPPGQQPPAGECSELERTAPRGAWVVYRPTSEKKVVRLR